MTLEALLDRFDSVERSIVVVNRTDPDPVVNMLSNTFGDGSVTVVDGRVSDTGRGVRDGGTERIGGSDPCRPGMTTREFTASRGAGRNDGSGPVIDVEALRRNENVPFDGDDPSAVENLALLIEGDEVIAGSTLDALGDAVLFVNTDLYTTGSRSVDEIGLPSVVTGLNDTTFTLKGYPESNRQKLLLVTISRFIERVAWRAGEGTIRSSFQRLSRLTDELGTRRVYENVIDAGVDTHLYGVPDDPPTALDATIHGGRSADFTDSWFVVFTPPDGPSSVDDAGSDLERGMRGGVGLLAVETSPRVWQGAWTFDAGKVETIDGYIERNL